MAMVDAIGEKGYRTTTVADVISRAGASRKTFYKHFANKQECFLATYDLVWARSRRRVARAYRAAEGWPARVEAAIGALFEAAIENPSALRLATVEIGALGPAGIERREQSVAEYERFIRDAVELAPGEGRISDTAARAVVGGLYRILDRGVSSGEHSELLELVPDLVTWVTSYYPAPPAIAKSRRSRARTRAGVEGGRAPGTLSPHSPLRERRGLARGNQNVSRSFVIHSQRERILDAVANLTASKGYAALGVNDIAEEAAVSLGAFYEHFADKQDAFLVAYELGHAKGLAFAERAYAAQPDWRTAVRAGIAALFQFLASEPAFAHIALVDALTATSRTAERSSAGVRAFARMLVPGLQEAPGYRRPPVVTIEAIAAGVFELCLQYSMQSRIHELPELTSDATYIALAPFIGGEEAARIATASVTSRASSPRGP
jgi:AcrR family transcriptional regulator